MAIVMGGGAGAAKLYRSRLIARMRNLLGLSTSLDPSEGKFKGGELTLEGPPIRLRAYLDREET